MNSFAAKLGLGIRTTPYLLPLGCKMADVLHQLPHGGKSKCSLARIPDRRAMVRSASDSHTRTCIEPYACNAAFSKTLALAKARANTLYSRDLYRLTAPFPFSHNYRFIDLTGPEKSCVKLRIQLHS